MPQLHEIIAVEEGLKTTAIKVVTEGRTTFTKKEAHFDGAIKNYTPKTEDDEKKPGESKPVVETVGQKLDYIFKHVAAALDISSTKEKTNTIAKADLIINGKTVATEVPVTTLVQIENKLRALRPLLEDIPTLDATQIWKPSDIQDVLETDERIVQSTKKILRPVVLAQATDKHPAQIEKTYLDVVAGEWRTKILSGRISTSEKSKLLGRLDEAIRAVKQARQRANSAEVIKQEFGTELMEFVLGRKLRPLQ